MNLQDLLKLLRKQWLMIVCLIALGGIGAVILNMLTTPLYQASTRLFVSAAAGSSLSDTYQGNRFSQERVVSYTELLMGETLAQRTIDKLGLHTTASELASHVKASAKVDTVLINVNVTDESPVQARDIANTLSDEFVALVRELEMPEDGSSPDARVVVEQRASIPDKPITPKTARNIAMGLLLGTAIGVGTAVLRNLLDNTVTDREIIEEVTGVGLVGNIPMDKERRKEAAISFDGDKTSISEAFRKLRTNLQFLSVDNPPRVLAITSSVPSEGKSTTALNIALALAEDDHNVVLVDGDMRRPTIHKHLGLIGTVGFSTVLSGAASLSESLQTTRFPRLTVLSSGAIPPNPSELLGSQAAKTLLHELRSEFDYVIIDSTPLLAVTDAAILAAAADGVILVTRYSHTRRDQLAHAKESLADVGASILGAVLTMTPTRGASSYSYSYYGEESKRSRLFPLEKRVRGSQHPGNG